MTTNYHTAIPSSPKQAAGAATFNSRLSDLDTAIGLGGGGADATATVLKAWVESGAYQMTIITPDSDKVISSATVKWPDGSSGTFTRTSKNATWVAVDAYTITHVDSGQIVTQPAVTRDSSGTITNKPELTVGAIP